MSGPKPDESTPNIDLDALRTAFAELAEAEARATPGPWDDESVEAGRFDIYACPDDRARVSVAEVGRLADVNFLLLARNLSPGRKGLEMAAEIVRLRARIEELEIETGMRDRPGTETHDEFGRRLLAQHFHARRHHRTECQCSACSWNGREPCSESSPCRECRERNYRPIPRSIGRCSVFVDHLVSLFAREYLGRHSLPTLGHSEEREEGDDLTV